MKLYYLLLLLVKYVTRPVDPFIKIGLAFMAIGFAPLAGGLTCLFVFSKETLGNYLPIFESAEITWSKANAFSIWAGGGVFILGVVFCIIGLIIYSTSLLKKDVAIFSFRGFENLDDPDLKKLLSLQDRLKHICVDLPKFNSRDKNEFMKHCLHMSYIIKQRVNHKRTEKGVIFALGSTPALYAFGSFFRDGHTPLTIYDFKRTDNIFIPLNYFPENCSLIYKYNEVIVGGINGLDIKKLQDISISISFTSNVLIEDLPENLRGDVLDISLSTGYKYNSLPEEEEQKDIALKVTHTISSLKKHSKKVHLFISAQASFVTRLGSLYQEGMHGEVEVYQWDSTTNSYVWSLNINGDRIH